MTALPCEPIADDGQIKTPWRLLSRAARFKEIEANRKKNSLSIAALTTAADVDHRAYLRAKAGAIPRAVTLAALEGALASLTKPKRRPADDRGLVASLGALTLLACRTLKLSDDALAGHDLTNGPLTGEGASAAAQARGLALYVMHTACGYSQPRLGTLCGISRVAVHLMIRSIEDRRHDDQAFDAAVTGLERAAQAFQGDQ